jgi:hypothetical protein
MDDASLILRLRAEALRANLEKLKDHMAARPDPRTGLKDLQNRLTNAWKALTDLRGQVSDAQRGLDADKSPIDIANDLGTTEQKMRALVTQLRDAETNIKSMQEKCYRIDEHEIGKAVAEDLEKRTKDPIQVLTDIEVDLRKNGANFQHLWKTLFATTNAVSQTIFTEYIEFLGGFALRDTGFDAGISRVADEMLQSYSTRKNLYMMAIPTRQQAVAMTLARIVRVTFPDWTIWSLPSTAHEFWHVVAWKDLEGKLRSALRQLPGNKSESVEPRFNNCLGDAFATYTMGPAYAFFAIFLLLDPSSSFTSSDEDAAQEVRAYSICQMLEYMDNESPLDSPYKNLRKDLGDAWAASVAQIGAKPSNEQEQQVTADKHRVTDLVKALWATLKESTSPPFTIEIWHEIKSWVPPLVQADVDQINQINIPPGAELRHVLNAAWLARVHPDRKKDITEIANKLAQRVTMPKSNQ